jgi:hypothetical protein
MIDGKKVIAFTPSGRRRYMEILWRHVEYQHAMGYIDEWVLFNNSYTWEDAHYTRDLVSRGPDWIKVIEVPLPNEGPGQTAGIDHRTRQRVTRRSIGSRPGRNAGHISTFYPHLREHDCIYVRLDDDLCYLDPHSIERLVRDKIAHPEAWLSYPVIVNNTRMSYWLQQAGVISPEPPLTNVFLEPTAWRSGPFVESLHRQALPYAVAGKLSQKFRLPLNRVLSNQAEPGVADPQYAEGHVSVNCFVIDGKDMVACNVTRDEEGYLSDHRPKALNRRNRICGDSTVIHFAYHPCTAHMEATGLLAEYQTLADSIMLEKRWPCPQQ